MVEEICDAVLVADGKELVEATAALSVNEEAAEVIATDTVVEDDASALTEDESA